MYRTEWMRVCRTDWWEWISEELKRRRRPATRWWKQREKTSTRPPTATGIRKESSSDDGVVVVVVDDEKQTNDVNNTGEMKMLFFRSLSRTNDPPPFGVGSERGRAFSSTLGDHQTKSRAKQRVKSANADSHGRRQSVSQTKCIVVRGARCYTAITGCWLQDVCVYVEKGNLLF